MPIFQLVYVSTLVNEYGAALPSILEAAIRKNRLSGLKCILLCSHGNVMQAIEGDQASVQQLFLRIANDVRHFDVQLVNESVVQVPALTGVNAGLDRITLQTVGKVSDAECFRLDSGMVRDLVKPGVVRALLTEFADTMR